MLSTVRLVVHTVRRPNSLVKKFFSAGSVTRVMTRGTWKMFFAIWATMMFTLSSGVAMATASQVSMPA